MNGVSRFVWHLGLLGPFSVDAFLLRYLLLVSPQHLSLGYRRSLFCKSLGFFEGSFTLIRRSNERPNTQFTIQFLTHGLNSDKFPDILPYLATGQKTIIHRRTVNQVSQVYAYIWRL